VLWAKAMLQQFPFRNQVRDWEVEPISIPLAMPALDRLVEPVCLRTLNCFLLDGNDRASNLGWDGKMFSPVGGKCGLHGRQVSYF